MRERDLVKEQDPVDLDAMATEVAMGRFCDNHSWEVSSKSITWYFLKIN